jgi:hypothetical protein
LSDGGALEQFIEPIDRLFYAGLAYRRAA